MKFECPRCKKETFHANKTSDNIIFEFECDTCYYVEKNTDLIEFRKK